MLTANAMREHIVQALAAGADHLIAKPITPERLMQGVEATLERADASDARDALAGQVPPAFEARDAVFLSNP